MSAQIYKSISLLHKPLSKKISNLIFIPSSILLLAIIIGVYIAVTPNSLDLLQSQYVHEMQVLLPPPTPITIKIPPPTSTPTPIPTPAIAEGAIQWNEKAQQIDPPPFYNIFKEVTYNSYPKGSTSDDINANYVAPTITPVNGVTYFKVGTWTSGLYTGADVINVIISRSVDNFSYGKYINTTTGYSILRTALYNGKIIYFPNSSSIYGFTVPQASFITVDEHKLPDLLFSYPLSVKDERGNDNETPYPVTYQGKTKSMYFGYYGDNGNSWDLNATAGYTFLTTFFHGQKLYVRTRNSNYLSWDEISHNPYLVEDVDHSVAPIIDDYVDRDLSSSPDKDATQSIQWLDQRLNPPDLFYNAQDYYYHTNFERGCQYRSAAELSKQTGFSLSSLKPVMQHNDDMFYFPEQADVFYANLFAELNLGLVKVTRNGKSIQVSYSDFIKTFPILVQKDAFGQYRLYYRIGYPDESGSC